MELSSESSGASLHDLIMSYEVSIMISFSIPPVQQSQMEIIIIIIQNADGNKSKPGQSRERDN